MDETDLSEARAEARAVIVSHCEPLLQWLMAEGLKWEDAHEVTDESVIEILKQWRLRGCLTVAKQWHLESVRDLGALGLGTKLAREQIVWAYAHVRFADREVKRAREEPLNDSPELATLPASIRWIYLHPGLNPQPSKQQIDRYEDFNPCPDQGTLSRYLHIRESVTLKSEFFKQVDKLLVDGQRMLQQSGPEQAVEKLKWTERLVDLKRELYREDLEESLELEEI